MPVIRITDATWGRLKRWAVPLDDSPDDAVRKVLDAAEEHLKCPQTEKQINMPPDPILSTGQGPVSNFEYLKDNNPSVLECALWYKELLTEYYGEIETKYFKDYIWFKWAGKRRVSVVKLKNNKARIRVKFYEGNISEVVDHLNKEGLQFSRSGDTDLLFKNLDLGRLKEKQVTHEWTVQRIVPRYLIKKLHE